MLSQRAPRGRVRFFNSKVWASAGTGSNYIDRETKEQHAVATFVRFSEQDNKLGGVFATKSHPMGRRKGALTAFLSSLDSDWDR